MKFKRLFQKVFYPTLKRYYVSILSFKVEIFKPKNFFYPTLKKHNFFLMNIEYIEYIY